MERYSYKVVPIVRKVSHKSIITRNEFLIISSRLLDRDFGTLFAIASAYHFYYETIIHFSPFIFDDNDISAVIQKCR